MVSSVYTFLQEKQGTNICQLKKNSSLVTRTYQPRQTSENILDINERTS